MAVAFPVSCRSIATLCVVALAVGVVCTGSGSSSLVVEMV
jgi:hypothetical protein